MATEAKDMKIFEKHEDYKNWEKLCQHCEVLEGFTDVEKERAKRAFLHLREDLGENFLEVAFDAGHPICQYFANLAPWTRKWIIWFAEAVRELKEQDNYLSLLNRIKDKDTFNEGFSVLEMAYKFSKAGFKISIDPPINISGITKKPDLRIVNEDNREEFFVEVSVSEESRIEREASQTMQKITEPLWRSVPFMDYCGRIHKTLAERHLDEIVNKIGKMVEKVKKEGVLQELVVEDVIEIGIAPGKDKQFLEKWAAERGLKVGEFSGPPFDVDEILRIKRKIEKEQKQLPNTHPNIVIVRNNNLFFHIRDIRKVMSELEEEVYNYPHLLAAIIVGGHIGAGAGENVIIMKDQHVFIKKTIADVLVEKYLILLNRFCNLKISPAAITKIYNTFRSY